jgi:hypothetical protein
MKKIKPGAVLMFAVALASALARAKWGFGMHDGV